MKVKKEKLYITQSIEDTITQKIKTIPIVLQIILSFTKVGLFI